MRAFLRRAEQCSSRGKGEVCRRGRSKRGCLSVSRATASESCWYPTTTAPPVLSRHSPICACAHVQRSKVYKHRQKFRESREQQSFSKFDWAVYRPAEKAET